MKRSAARHGLATAALLLGTGMLAAACGSVAGSTNGSGTKASPRSHISTVPASPASASPSATASAQAAVSRCLSSGLKVRVAKDQAGGAAGSIYYPIDFTNVSGQSCTLLGYPGVSFTSGQGGSQIGQPASRSPGGSTGPVTLAPGAVAHATLRIADAANYPASQCKPVTANWLKVFPPNDFTPVFTQFTAQVCAGKVSHGGTQLSIYAMRPGAGKRGQAP